MDLALTGKVVLVTGERSGPDNGSGRDSRQLKPCPLDVVSKAEDAP